MCLDQCPSGYTAQAGGNECLPSEVVQENNQSAIMYGMIGIASILVLAMIIYVTTCVCNKRNKSKKAKNLSNEMRQLNTSVTLTPIKI